MIDSAVLKRLLILAAALLAVSSCAAVAFGAPLPFAGGIALGFLLGAAPVASWAWIAPRLLQGRGRALALAVLVLKLGLYAGALYLCVTKSLVNPVGVLVGMTGVGAVVVLGLLLRSPAAAKEVG